MENFEEKLGEQPEDVQPSLEEDSKGSPNGEFESENVEKFEESEAERGVPVGKFKNVDDLYQAYNNLQAEFTRKSQKLAELEKDKTTEPSKEEKFDEEFKSFLLDNQEAFLYADQIKAKVLQDESLQKQERPFEKAWADMIYQKLSAPDRAKEPFVQNLILNDNELKNLVIENYMKQLQEQKTPFVMSSGAGERVTKPVAPKPDSFDEAKKVVMDLLS